MQTPCTASIIWHCAWRFCSQFAKRSPGGTNVTCDSAPHQGPGKTAASRTAVASPPDLCRVTLMKCCCKLHTQVALLLEWRWCLHQRPVLNFFKSQVLCVKTIRAHSLPQDILDQFKHSATWHAARASNFCTLGGEKLREGPNMPNAP